MDRGLPTAANGKERVPQAKDIRSSNRCSFHMPLHYPRYTGADYESMPEWMLDRLLSDYGILIDAAVDVDSKRRYGPEFDGGSASGQTSPPHLGCCVWKMKVVRHSHFIPPKAAVENKRSDHITPEAEIPPAWPSKLHNYRFTGTLITIEVCVFPIYLQCRRRQRNFNGVCSCNPSPDTSGGFSLQLTPCLHNSILNVCGSVVGREESEQVVEVEICINGHLTGVVEVGLALPAKLFKRASKCRKRENACLVSVAEELGTGSVLQNSVLNLWLLLSCCSALLPAVVGWNWRRKNAAIASSVKMRRPRRCIGDHGQVFLFRSKATSTKLVGKRTLLIRGVDQVDGPTRLAAAAAF
ncbi:hypothetical protein ZIOFF_048174 [Zingiber officinale]|uniref:DUF7722 domain-containing protein n=1 Tax=Zingiber officinale TaxID=94328 RepID=A0A8J5FZC0_ZINOF|nr:hypothetical protein ZIOFF_048174 [Zingiber officinale]